MPSHCQSLAQVWFLSACSWICYPLFVICDHSGHSNTNHMREGINIDLAKHGLLWHGSFIALFLAGLVSIAQNFYSVVRGYANNYKMSKCFLLHWTGFAYIINKKNWLFIRFSLLWLDCERCSFPIFLIIIKCMTDIQIMMNTKCKIGSY